MDKVTGFKEKTNQYMPKSKMTNKSSQWGNWMKLAQDGDRASYEKLLREITEVLTVYFKKRIWDTKEVDDLIQETLLGIHNARHTYNVDRPFFAWMYAIAHYKYVDYVRKKEKQRTNEVLGDTIFDQMFTKFGPDQDDYSDIYEALEKLPMKQKLAIKSLKIDGLSSKESAIRLGMSVSALKVNAHRGYKKLRELLDRRHP